MLKLLYFLCQLEGNKMKKLTIAVFLMLSLWTKTAILRPMSILEKNQPGSDNTELRLAGNHVRIRRSVAKRQDVNLYSEGDSDSLPDHDVHAQPGDLKSEVSSLIFTNHVGSILQSLKTKNDKKSSSKSALGDRAVNFEREEESVNNEGLSSDEQEECYRQQNLDPPSRSNIPSHQSNKHKIHENRISKGTYVKPDIYRRKGLKRLGKTKNVISLYSDPQNVQNTNKDSSRYDHRESAVDFERRVYRPIGVQAEFPVYDEDIDFHPDPLQGILEDKYWLDSEEQEEIIRKYLDLANHVNPPRIDYIKRDTPESRHEAKSVDSKEAFKAAEPESSREYPYRMVSACDDCQRGKWRKRNNTNGRDEGLSMYGGFVKRKLLSSYEDVELEHSHIHDKVLSNQENYSKVKNIQYEADTSFPSNLNDGNKMSVGYRTGTGELKQENEYPAGVTFRYYGRKLLSIYNDDSSQEQYVDEGEEEFEAENIDIPLLLTTHSNNLLKQSFLSYEENQEHYEDDMDINKNDNRRSVAADNNLIYETSDSKIYLQNVPLSHKPRSSKPVENNHIPIMNYSIDNTINKKYETSDKFLQLQRPYILGPQDLSRYYVPDKLGNLIQKSVINKKKKSKSTTKNMIDISHEFELIRNETFMNVSIQYRDVNISMTTETSNLVKRHNKLGKENNFLGKERRSYSFPFIKRPTVKTVLSLDESPLSGMGVQKKVSSDNSSIHISSDSATLPENITLNGTVEQLKFTTEIISTVLTASENISTISTSVNPKKKEEDYDEELVDAEIANEIVESVIAESQSGSVMGHNLGLCRKNESMAKYARVSPETELLLKRVTECILDHIRDHLERQSCTLLEDQLLQFLKWMVLGGESYKSYLGAITPELYEFNTKFHVGHDLSYGSEASANFPASVADVQGKNKTGPSEVNSSNYSILSAESTSTSVPKIQTVTVNKT